MLCVVCCVLCVVCCELCVERGRVMFRFEKLDVWQRAVAFAGKVYERTGEFPDGERFGLVSQVRRAAVSVSSNIAEGSGRGTGKEFIRFLDIACGSLMEVVSQLQIAVNQKFLKMEDHQSLCADAEELARMLSGLRSSVESRTKTTDP